MSYYSPKSQRYEGANHANSTEMRRAAALRYIVISLNRDPEPIVMVNAILAGERDDVVRSMTGAERAALDK